MVLPLKQQKTSYGYVTYEIHLHPTYQAPCLWFSLNGLPADEPAFNIDTVFRRLVPDQFKDGLRRAGSVGGISADVSLLFSSHHISFFVFVSCDSVGFNLVAVGNTKKLTRAELLFSLFVTVVVKHTRYEKKREREKKKGAYTNTQMSLLLNYFGHINSIIPSQAFPPSSSTLVSSARPCRPLTMSRSRTT